ncbi:MAG: hypothetical protein LBM59_07130 [Ruminococcus sp.]|nr:hypothetical protein [Ruminococcus sp.]
MIYSGFLIETEIGSRNFLGASVKQPEKIKLVNDKGVYGKIMNNNITAAHIYYEGLIREFEYIYNMSWYYVNHYKSVLLDESKNKQKLNYIQKARDEYFNGRSNFINADKEESTILFLIAMFYITKCSTEIQIEEGTRELFEKTFVINIHTHENHYQAYYPLDKMMGSVENKFFDHLFLFFKENLKENSNDKKTQIYYSAIKTTKDKASALDRNAPDYAKKLLKLYDHAPEQRWKSDNWMSEYKKTYGEKPAPEYMGEFYYDLCSDFTLLYSKDKDPLYKAGTESALYNLRVLTRGSFVMPIKIREIEELLNIEYA